MERVGGGPAQQGAFPGRPAGARSPRAVPTVRSLGARPQSAAGWTQGRTPGGAELRAVAARVGAGPKGRFRVTSPTQRRPFKTPSVAPSPTGVFGDTEPGDPGAQLPQGAGSPWPPLPSRHAPPRRPPSPAAPLPHSLAPRPPLAPLKAPPPRSRAAGPSARCRRPRRRRESPGRTLSARSAEGGGAATGAAGAVGRRPGLGFLLRQTPPHPADPTPCSFLLGGARSGPRSEVGGRRRVRAVSRVGEGGAEAARGAVVGEPRGPRQRRPLARLSGTSRRHRPARESGPWAPRLSPRSGLLGTPLGERNAPAPLRSPWPSARAAG